MTKKTSLLTFAILVVLASNVFADQGSFTNSGGSTLVTSSVNVSSLVASPAGSMTLDCPITSPTVCSGGSITYFSKDGATSLSGSFTSGKVVESCSGGGRGGHVVCGYDFTGFFVGGLVVDGLSQSVTGVTNQSFGVTAGPAQGSTAYNSAYEPFYYSDGQKIHRAESLSGIDVASFGTLGAGVDEFDGPYGLALDSARRLYIADAFNCRVVRIDNITGANWTTYGGTCGSGHSQFRSPSGIAIDKAGRIYVADTGNSRIVRIDDMKGTNWIAYGTPGAGVGQFAPDLSSVAVDTADRIYIPDSSNKRIVRIDDMAGANWVALTRSKVVNGYSYAFQSPSSIAIDSQGRIYIADSTSVVRVDDMAGSNWTSIATGSTGLKALAVNASNTVFAGGGNLSVIDNFTGVIPSTTSLNSVYGVVPIPVASPRPPALRVWPWSLAFGSHNVGTTSPSQVVNIRNFGGHPLNLKSIVTSAGFYHTTDCPVDLIAPASCTIHVYFSPKATGAVNGRLTFGDNSGNLGSTQFVPLTGQGKAPVAPAITAP